MRSACILWLVLCPVALACKVPVFRYALERWEADPYRAVVMHRGSAQSAEAIGKLVAPLQEAAANLEVTILDVEALTEEQQWQYDDLDGVGDEARLRLYHPYHTDAAESPFWEGELHADTVATILHSPVREEIADAIVSGASTTWVLLESGDAAKDQAFHERLETLLAKISQTLSIPEGVVKAEDVTADGTLADGTPLEMDDVLRTGIPLKIAFPVVRLARDAAEEAVFVAMLQRFAGHDANER